MICLGLLPLLVMVLLVAALRCGGSAEETAFREDFLRAALILGVSLLFGTELLGLFHAISRGGILVLWGAAFVAAAGALAARWRARGRPSPPSVPDLDAREAVLLASGAAVAAALLLVAWLAPPQSSDSLGYHMSRVMHWAQDRSLEPYPTRDSPQLFQPPFAEVVRLNLLLLSGGDRAGCLLQWAAAMACLLAASLVARDLGGGRRAQMFAALLALTLPIGVTQASSGKNGWVEAFWLLALAHFGSAGASSKRPGTAILASAAALGLDLATKVTSFFFSLPLALCNAIRWRRAGRRAAAPAAAGAILALAIVAPQAWRNFSVYGDPIADPLSRGAMGMRERTPALVASNALRNAASQFGTPSRSINAGILRGIVALHRLLGVDAFDPRTSVLGRFSIAPPTRIEELAPSPLHILLVALAGAAVLVSRRLRSGGRPSYLLALCAGYILYCAGVRWQPPSARLLMPLLVLAAPLVAVAAEALAREAVPAVSAVLLAACLPYVFATAGRPLSFSPGGLLSTPRLDLYFARFPQQRPVFEEIARTVREKRVGNLGIALDGSASPEYLLWVLLSGERPPVRIEHVQVPGAPGALSSRLPFSTFRPELIVAVAAAPGHPAFASELRENGERYAFVRSARGIGFYEPVTERRSP